MFLFSSGRGLGSVGGTMNERLWPRKSNEAFAFAMKFTIQLYNLSCSSVEIFVNDMTRSKEIRLDRNEQNSLHRYVEAISRILLPSFSGSAAYGVETMHLIGSRWSRTFFLPGQSIFLMNLLRSCVWQLLFECGHVDVLLPVEHLPFEVHLDGVREVLVLRVLFQISISTASGKRTIFQFKISRFENYGILIETVRGCLHQNTDAVIHKCTRCTLAVRDNDSLAVRGWRGPLASEKSSCLGQRPKQVMRGFESKVVR